MLHRTAVGSWTNAVMFARLSAQPDELVKDLLRMAYRCNGADFVDGLMEAMESVEEISVVVQLLDGVMEETGEAGRQDSFIMRVPDPDGEMTEFVFVPEE